MAAEVSQGMMGTGQVGALREEASEREGRPLCTSAPTPSSTVA